MVRAMQATQRLGNNPEQSGAISGVSQTVPSAWEVYEMISRILKEMEIVNRRR
jgi:hypothetical protein